jgi:cathepsin H
MTGFRHSALLRTALAAWAAASAYAQDWTLAGLDLRGEHKSLMEEPLLGARFGAWMAAHGHNYSAEEVEYRKAIWVTSHHLVVAHNSQPSPPPYTLALNQFAALTPEEFSRQYLMQAPQASCSATRRPPAGALRSDDAQGPSGWSASAEDVAALPKAVDWRTKGVLSPVKSQGSCGSCWTFSTTGAVEAHLAIYRNEKLLLSEQQLVDCAQAFDNHGCQGGLPSHAFEYIRTVGIETEEEYPYKAVQARQCYYDKDSKTLAKVQGSVNITEGDEDSLSAAIATKGPVSIAFKVQADFRLYGDGVYVGFHCPNGPSDVNHAVLAVGFNETAEVPYYIVKNSWGDKWGEKGFFRIKKGVNMCGLAVCASYPLV